MDIGELIKSFSKSERTIVAALITHLPIAYSLAFLGSCRFIQMELIPQICIAVSIAVLFTFVGFMLNIILATATNEDEPMLCVIIGPAVLTFGYAVIDYALSSITFLKCLIMYLSSCFGIYVPVIIFIFCKSISERKSRNKT